ncbi:hypothetical protein, variant [Verruconis gallopava]|uniref:mitogen-activated protein kinase kinase n=1 Tax=Verruconis gallopava TaxID=253628 RepID=A0A0D2AEA4_9PEZI|nr:uncharacterized protein PV09_03982 [Verruconis gallopava]XP_016214665.1 hypothetical protein, variant [Verruconis gallopava]KIW04795.1 hypothetical protein PV09_03982 [Verruconis gallopava]KIW04796.1 hypothetical protein, variant [Verruconis gallopava]
MGDPSDPSASPEVAVQNNMEPSPTTADAPAIAPPTLSPRSASAAANITTSSTPLGNINAARRPPPAAAGFQKRGSGLNMNADLAARMKAFHLGRQGAPANRPSPISSLSDNAAQSATRDFAPGASPSPAGSTGATLTPTGAQMAMPGGIPAGFKLPNGAPPQLKNIHSAPAAAGAFKKPSLAEKRGMALPGGLPGSAHANGTGSSQAGGASRPSKKKPGLTLSQITGEQPNKDGSSVGGTALDKYAQYLDAKTGTLRFAGKAVLSSHGVEFASGSSFSISLDEVDTLDELGKGNYGTVYKVRHSRPKIRRPGLGLAGNKLRHNEQPVSPTRKSADDKDDSSPTLPPPSAGTTGVIMAMKEMRLELDDAKFASIVMELDILHRCVSPYIVDFYGAFFQEGAVYVCMEFMDGGSIDKLYGNGVPENVLRKITYSTVQGLRFLKDELNIIHRDVKPTNILINTKGQVKICDFGVSGNLVASFAKTNIGCQSYMAPERISTGAADAVTNPGGGTYSVQSDIWSLGLTIIECALGRYPYPPETYNNIFSQLSAIVNGDPPDLPEEGFSDAARNFVHGCLNKIPKLRPTYAMLLQHAWLAPLSKPAAILEEDEEEEEEKKEEVDKTEGDSSPTALREEPENVDSRLPADVVDPEVGLWVIETLEAKRAGKLARADKPALHAAPLDAVASTSPAIEKKNGDAVGVS